MEALLSRACEALDLYKALGNEVVGASGARIVRNEGLPTIFIANHASGIRAETPEQIDALLARCDEAFANHRHRCFFCDPLTPPSFEARLVLEGYEVEPTLQLLLEGALRSSPPAVEIRLAETASDWESLRVLHRVDHLEEARKAAREPYAEQTTRDLVRAKRLGCPPVRFWIARADDRDCAFFSSWCGPGSSGGEQVGVVEDLFTHPDYRGRGIATALIDHAVRDARALGARPLVIGAVPDDTPRIMYAALGFRPLCVTRHYLLRKTC